MLRPRRTVARRAERGAHLGLGVRQPHARDPAVDLDQRLRGRGARGRRSAAAATATASSRSIRRAMGHEPTTGAAGPVRVARCWRSAASSTPRGREAWLRGDAGGDRLPGPAAARRHRRLVPGRRLRSSRTSTPPRRGSTPTPCATRSCPVLDRPYEPERARRDRGGDRGRRAGADRADRRLAGRRGPASERLRERARRPRSPSGCGTGTARRRSCRCPVRTGDGRILGVLAIARSLPQPAFDAEELRVAECSPTWRRSRSSAPSCWTARSAGRATRRCSTAPRRRSAARSTSTSCRRDRRPGRAR